MGQFNVFLEGTLIDTRFFCGVTADQVKQHLIYKLKFNPQIKVVKVMSEEAVIKAFKEKEPDTYLRFSIDCDDNGDWFLEVSDLRYSVDHPKGERTFYVREQFDKNGFSTINFEEV